jgi:hypothetical protein
VRRIRSPYSEESLSLQRLLGRRRASRRQHADLFAAGDGVETVEPEREPSAVPKASFRA